MSDNKITFREIFPQDAKLILDWRTSQRISRQMKTDVLYDIEKQEKWILSCYDKPDYYHWIVLDNDNPVGVIILSDYNRESRQTSWGFYLAENCSPFLALKIPHYLHVFAFEELGVDTIHIDVFYSNTAIIKLHLANGYVFFPERDQTITKNGKQILCIALMLKREAWKLKKSKHYKADFPIQLWKHRLR